MYSISYYIKGVFGTDPDSPRNVSYLDSIYKPFLVKIESLDKSRWNHLTIDPDSLLEMN
jgi:hypothetical protein